MMFHFALLIVLIEGLFGYPGWLNRAIGHPVMWIGALISWADRKFNRAAFSARRRQGLGVALVFVLVLLSAIAAGLILLAVILVFGGGSAVAVLIPLAILASPLLAQRSLYTHVAAVARALEIAERRAGQDSSGAPKDLGAARRDVARIVGRDVSALDEAGIARAAIESLAENFSDGVVAPATWLAIGGLPGGLAYKAINTADSMIGHKTSRHKDFGWAAARLDDWLNLPASRLTALLLIGAAALSPSASAAQSWHSVKADAKHHRSPNAGWPEAAMAGALSLSLAGARHYDGALVDDAEMGRGGRRAASAADIRAALKLYVIADGLLIVLLALAAAVMIWLAVAT